MHGYALSVYIGVIKKFFDGGFYGVWDKTHRKLSALWSKLDDHPAMR